MKKQKAFLEKPLVLYIVGVCLMLLSGGGTYAWCRLHLPSRDGSSIVADANQDSTADLGPVANQDYDAVINELNTMRDQAATMTIENFSYEPELTYPTSQMVEVRGKAQKYIESLKKVKSSKLAKDEKFKASYAKYAEMIDAYGQSTTEMIDSLVIFSNLEKACFLSKGEAVGFSDADAGTQNVILNIMYTRCIKYVNQFPTVSLKNFNDMYYQRYATSLRNLYEFNQKTIINTNKTEFTEQETETFRSLRAEVANVQSVTPHIENTLNPKDNIGLLITSLTEQRDKLAS